MAEKQTNFDFSDEDKVISSDFVNFNEQKEVIGILEEIRDGAFGKEYVLTTQEGKSIVVGSYSALNSLIKTDYVNKAIKIVYLGDKKSDTGRMYKTFELFVKN